jgi:hypothetical protein
VVTLRGQSGLPPAWYSVVFTGMMGAFDSGSVSCRFVSPVWGSTASTLFKVPADTNGGAATFTMRAIIEHGALGSINTTCSGDGGASFSAVVMSATPIYTNRLAQ